MRRLSSLAHPVILTSFVPPALTIISPAAIPLSTLRLTGGTPVLATRPPLVAQTLCGLRVTHRMLAQSLMGSLSEPLFATHLRRGLTRGSSYTFWQYSDSASVIGGDANTFNGDSAGLLRLARGS